MHTQACVSSFLSPRRALKAFAVNDSSCHYIPGHLCFNLMPQGKHSALSPCSLLLPQSYNLANFRYALLFNWWRNAIPHGAGLGEIRLPYSRALSHRGFQKQDHCRNMARMNQFSNKCYCIQALLKLALNRQVTLLHRKGKLCRVRRHTLSYIICY